MRKAMTAYFCDFCGKSADDSEVMVSGPNGAAICSGCVKIAQDVIVNWRQHQDHSPQPMAPHRPVCSSGLDQSPLDVLLS